MVWRISLAQHRSSAAALQIKAGNPIPLHCVRSARYLPVFHGSGFVFLTLCLVRLHCYQQCFQPKRGLYFLFRRLPRMTIKEQIHFQGGLSYTKGCYHPQVDSVL